MVSWLKRRGVCAEARSHGLHVRVSGKRGPTFVVAAVAVDQEASPTAPAL